MIYINFRIEENGVVFKKLNKIKANLGLKTRTEALRYLIIAFSIPEEDKEDVKED